MFLKRLVSGVLLLIAAVALLYYGNVSLLIAMAGISLIGQRELYRAIGIDHKGIAAIGYAMTAVYYTLLHFQGREYVAEMMVGALVVFMTAYVITFPEYKTEEISGAFFGMCYVSVLMSYVYLTRMSGMLFGRHKMVPKLSPKKSWEGAVGGVLGAALLGLIYGFLFRNRMTEIMNPLLSCSVACAIGAVISMIGDLAASAIKRNHGIKDFGSCIPGHGGILDRFDSVLFTAPAIFYALLLVGRFT